MTLLLVQSSALLRLVGWASSAKQKQRCFYSAAVAVGSYQLASGKCDALLAVLTWLQSQKCIQVHSL